MLYVGPNTKNNFFLLLLIYLPTVIQWRMNTRNFTNSDCLLFKKDNKPTPDEGPLKKTVEITLSSRDHKSGQIFMFDVILVPGEHKSIFRSICVHFKTIFHINLK